MNRIPQVARAFEDAQEFRVPFDSNAFSSAYVNAVAAVHDGADLILIMGPPGIGKSLLLRSVRDAVVRNGGMALCRSRPEGNLDETLEWLLGELRVVPGSPLRENRLQALAAFLDRRAAPVVVLVDDADNSPDRTLVALAALAIFRRDEGNKVQIVLASSAEIDKRLQRADLAWVADHVGARIHLEPLTRKEVGQYIAHRIVATRRWLRGRTVDAFAPDVVDRVAFYSSGLPRLVNLICRTAFSGSQTIIDVAQIDRAARECGLAGPSWAITDDMPVAAAPAPAIKPPIGSWILAQLRERRAVALRASYACAAALILVAGGVAVYRAPPDLGPAVSMVHGSVLDAAERLGAVARAVPLRLEAFAETVRQASWGRPKEPPVRVAMADLRQGGSLVLQEGWFASERRDAGTDPGSQRSQRSEPRSGNAGGVLLALSVGPATAVAESSVDVPADRDGLLEMNDRIADPAAATEAPAPELAADSPASAEPVEPAHADMAPVPAMAEQEPAIAEQEPAMAEQEPAVTDQELLIAGEESINAEQETPVVDAPVVHPVSDESSSVLVAAEPEPASGEVNALVEETTDRTGPSDVPPQLESASNETEVAPPPTTVTPPDDPASHPTLVASLEEAKGATQVALVVPQAEHPSPAVTETVEPPPPSPDVSAPEPPIRVAGLEPPAISQPAVDPAPATTSVLAVELLMMRGNEMLRDGDPASARLFFERAAAQGHARAMASVARTYDPIELRRLKLISFNGHPEQAIEWYRRAIEAGDRTSVEQLAVLEQWMSRRS